jgi:hypothetical protein
LNGAVVIDPATIWASGASRRLEAIDSIRLSAIDLTQRMTTDTFTVAIDTTGMGVIMTPREVRVIVPIRPIVQDTASDNAATDRGGS